MHLRHRDVSKMIPDGVLGLIETILIQARDEYEHDHDEKQQLARQHFD